MGNKCCSCCKTKQGYPDHKHDPEDSSVVPKSAEEKAEVPERTRERKQDLTSPQSISIPPESSGNARPTSSERNMVAQTFFVQNENPKYSLILVDASHNVLTVSWPETPDGEFYCLQYRSVAEGNSDEDYETLTVAQARKRNLLDPTGAGFYFRAGSIFKGYDKTIIQWHTHREPFYLLPYGGDVARMKAPIVSLGGTFESLLVSWNKVEDDREEEGTQYLSAYKYEIQMRENAGGEEWVTVAESFKGTEVRKKHLPSLRGYQFRVRPVGPDVKYMPFSPPSEPLVPIGLSPGVRRWFSPLRDGTLLSKLDEKPISLEEALGGKEFIILYATANWCSHCRGYASKMNEFYRTLPSSHKTVEVVFLSADHENLGFKDHYYYMPWLAVDYMDPGREEIMTWLKVEGIPRVAVIDGRTGRIVERNSVGRTLDVARWRKLLIDPPKQEDESDAGA